MCFSEELASFTVPPSDRHQFMSAENHNNRGDVPLAIRTQKNRTIKLPPRNAEAEMNTTSG